MRLRLRMDTALVTAYAVLIADTNCHQNGDV